jgi:hypothetical protein
MHALARRYGAEIAYEMFAKLFRRRLDGDDIVARSRNEDAGVTVRAAAP